MVRFGTGISWRGEGGAKLSLENWKTGSELSYDRKVVRGVLFVLLNIISKKDFKDFNW